MAVTISGSGVVTGLDSEASSDLGTKLEAAGGLVMVTPSTIANSGGTASLTDGAVSFSGVSSVSLNGVFTSAYENYVIMFLGNSGGVATHDIRLRASGTDDSTANSYSSQRASFDSTGSTLSRATASSGAVFVASNTLRTSAKIDVFAPALAQSTNFQVFNSFDNAGSFTLEMKSLRHNQTTSYDGFTLIASGSLTGTVRVYGYRNGI